LKRERRVGRRRKGRSEGGGKWYKAKERGRKSREGVKEVGGVECVTWMSECLGLGNERERERKKKIRGRERRGLKKKNTQLRVGPIY
jgi:hypothetical protein